MLAIAHLSHGEKDTTHQWKKVSSLKFGEIKTLRKPWLKPSAKHLTGLLQVPGKCTAKIPGGNWSGYKPHLMRASRPHVNAIWRSGYYSIPFELNEQGGPLPVPSTSLPSLVKELSKITQYKKGRRHSHSSSSSDTSSALEENQSFRVPDLPAGHFSHECSVGKSADNPIQIHDEPSQVMPENGPLCFEENGVESEVSSFSFKLRIPKGMRPSVHDELILRGLASPYDECRNAANDLLLMKQAHRSYTQNQLRRKENKFMDIFRSGRNFPTPDDLEKDLHSPHKPLRDAARSLFMNKMNKNRPLVETVQEYNKGLIDQYRKVQTKNNVRQGILERKEANMARRRGPQISSAVSWDPELWEAVDCEDPYVKMWAENYHKLLRKNVPSCHPDMIVVVKALNCALKEYNQRMKKEVQKEKEKLEEMKITKELRELYS